MPVWASMDAKDDLASNGKQRRHISDECPTYLANVPQAHRCATKGRPNTTPLQERTVRCEDPACWTKREREDALKPKRSGGGKKAADGGRTSATKAASAPTQKVGGKAASLADRAKAARNKPKVAAAA